MRNTQLKYYLKSSTEFLVHGLKDSRWCWSLQNTSNYPFAQFLYCDWVFGFLFFLMGCFKTILKWVSEGEKNPVTWRKQNWNTISAIQVMAPMSNTTPPCKYIGEGNDNPLQYSCMGNQGKRSLVGYNPWVQRVGHDLVPKQQTTYIYMASIFNIAPPYVYIEGNDNPLQYSRCI